MRDINRFVGAFGAYKIYEIVDMEKAQAKKNYLVLGPDPFLYATFKTWQDARTEAQRWAERDADGALSASPQES